MILFDTGPESNTVLMKYDVVKAMFSSYFQLKKIHEKVKILFNSPKI